MKKIFNTYTPEGFSNVNSYLFVTDPVMLIDFLQKAFYAEEMNRSIDEETGEIGNVILKIGDSCFMISQTRGEFEGMRTAFYLYVEDVDSIYQNAISHGATNVFEPADMDYGDRQGGVIDPAGNYWWISKRLTKREYSE